MAGTIDFSREEVIRVYMGLRSKFGVKDGTGTIISGAQPIDPHSPELVQLDTVVQGSSFIRRT